MRAPYGNVLLKKEEQNNGEKIKKYIKNTKKQVKIDKK